MHDREIRWFAFVPLALLVALLQLLAETAGVWGGFPLRPEILWCLAFYAALRVPPVQGLAAYFLCGVVRDGIVGAQPGAGALAYTLMGWLALHWRFLAAGHGWPGQAAFAGWAGIFVSMLRHGLDYGGLAYTLLSRVFFFGIGDGILTALAYLPLALAFGIVKPCSESASS